MKRYFFIIFALPMFLLRLSSTSAQDGTAVTIYRDKDSFSIYVSGNQIVTLQGLLFDVENANGKVFGSSLETSYAAFAGLDFSNIQAPVCFRLVRDNSSVTMPLNCQNLQDTQIFIQSLSDTDIFWYDKNRNVQFPIVITNGQKELKTCPGQNPECNLTYVPQLGDLPSGMAFIKGGTYHIGADEFSIDETVSQDVSVQDFAIDRTEVTNRSFQKFVDSGAYSDAQLWLAGWAWVNSTNGIPTVNIGGDDHPKIASWYEADTFCRWRDGHLPTENEWEIAAGWSGIPESPRTYPWGNKTPDTKLVDFGKINDPRPVASFPANALGLYDMAGNVREWVSDKFDANTYIVRGGSYLSTPEKFRVASREHAAPDFVLNSDIGFRCAKTINPSS